MSNFWHLCVAVVLVSGCHRDLTVHPCAHDRSLCADSAVADAPIDIGSDSIDETPSDACECTPGDVVEVSEEPCAGALEARLKTCGTTCRWGEVACAFRKGWTKIADAPSEFAGRLFASAIWTGGELIVFGGFSSSAFGEGRADGAMYSLQRNSWTLLPATTASGRHSHSAVWTNRELVVFGGSTADGPAADGFAYEPYTKAWRPLAAGPLSGRTRHAATYAPALRQMFVWGGQTATGDANDGAAYDAESDTWAPLPAAPISGRFEPFAAWTGTELLIWGGQTSGGGSSAPLADGALYNPTSRTWRAIPAVPVAARIRPKCAITGSGFLVFGGNGNPVPFDGALFNLTTSTWSSIARPSSAILTPRQAMQSWSDGIGLFVWSGTDPSVPAPYPPVTGGAIFDTASSSWSPLVGKDAPSPRSSAISIWTGKRAALIWGGIGRPGGGADEGLADGTLYVP